MSRPERRAEPSGPVEAAALDLPGGPRGVLLLHGFTGTPYELRPLGHALHAAGYTVCAPLLPGHGTTPEQMQTTGPADWERGAREALTRLATRCERIAVAGLSLGAALAIRLAALQPDQVHASIFMAAPFRLGLGFSALLLAYRFGPAAGLLPMFPKLGRSGGLVDPTHRAANPAYPVLPMRSGRQLLPFLLATRKLAGRVRQPSLVAHGAHDRITLPMGARQLARSLGSEQVWQLSLPRSAHVITLDHDRERLSAAAVAFLEQVL